MSPDPCQVIQSVYAAFNRWDLPARFGHFRADLVWEAADHSPLEEGSPYRGLDAARSQVFGLIGAHFGVKVAVTELLLAGDRVVALGHHEGAPKSTGRSFRLQQAHVWTLREGRVIRFQQCMDTLAMAWVLQP